jgi:hypothetical protein
VQDDKEVPAMMKKILQWIEEHAMAAAFASAGEHDTALEILGREKKMRKIARKRVRREKRVELRAPGFEG